MSDDNKHITQHRQQTQAETIEDDVNPHCSTTIIIDNNSTNLITSTCNNNNNNTADPNQNSQLLNSGNLSCGKNENSQFGISKIFVDSKTAAISQNEKVNENLKSEENASFSNKLQINENRDEISKTIVDNGAVLIRENDINKNMKNTLQSDENIKSLHRFKSQAEIIISNNNNKDIGAKTHKQNVQNDTLNEHLENFSQNAIENDISKQQNSISSENNQNNITLNENKPIENGFERTQNSISNGRNTDFPKNQTSTIEQNSQNENSFVSFNENEAVTENNFGKTQNSILNGRNPKNQVSNIEENCQNEIVATMTLNENKALIENSFGKTQNNISNGTNTVTELNKFLPINQVTNIESLNENDFEITQNNILNGKINISDVPYNFSNNQFSNIEPNTNIKNNIVQPDIELNETEHFPVSINTNKIEFLEANISKNATIPKQQRLGVGCAESGVFSKNNKQTPFEVKQLQQPSVRDRFVDASGRQASTPMSSMEEENLRERIHAAGLKQCTKLVQDEERYQKDAFKRLFQSKEFLEQLFRLFDQDRDNLLYQDNWIEFLKERLSDEKQIDFAEQIESVAYVLCGEDPITEEHFQQIFHAKGIVDKLFRLVDQDSIGTISAEQIMEFVSNITNTRPRTGFDKKSLESLEQLFRQTVGNEKEIRREDFQKIVSSKNPFFTERVFQIFDKDNSGSISLQEFLDSMHQFAGQSPDDKIKFLFKIYDIDGDGLIQHKELQHVMRACMEENGMQFSEEQIDDLTVAMFEDADTNHRGAITYEALKNQLEKHGGLLENLSISIDRWLVPPKPKNPPTSNLRKLIALRPYQLTRPYWKNNYVYLSFLAVFICVNIGLFISRAIQYKESNGFVIVARACGQCLNFNCMFILVLMLRQCITFLRTRGFSSILPLDQHIYLHKMVGMLITFYSALHTIMHLLNFSIIVVNDPKINEANYTLAEWLLTARPGLFGLVPGVANPTGIILAIILTIMFICSQAFVRRGGSFEVFYWTHLLYIPFWLLLIFHGPNFWKWFIVPGLVYLIERLVRLAWMKSERGKTYISSGLLLPSKVTHLVIKRPLHFDFHPGDYVFVNIPAIAKYEWHPFTISSAPEQEDYMWLHIRAVGEWTNRLYNYFEKEQEKLHNGEIPPLLSGGNCSNNQQSIEGKKVPSSIVTDSNTLKRLQASLKRKFSNRDPNRNKGDAQLVRYTHERYANETDGSSLPHVSASDGEIHNRACCSSNEHLNYPKSISPEKRLQMLLFHQKVPLEKSLSMPDIQTKAKKRERLLVLREYMRSESEKSFDECQIRRARLQSLGLAYLSPQNKSLAQSFRYMRHKPTIIAFKTPSLENCEQRNSSSSLGSVGRQTSAASFTSSPERHAEEGRFGPLAELSPGVSSLKPVNYPVGKPLEPIPEDNSLIESLMKTTDDDEVADVKEILGSGTEIYLDGPYGAPSSHIFRAQHAVMIATGIGVTPFASILQSIMHRYWKARHSCPKCKFSWASDIPPTVMNLRKVDFFWINRDQRSFEWFVNLLSQLEIEQAELGGAMERFLEMHMYITSALQKTDMKAVGLQLALDLLHEKEKRDLITGLKTRTNAGRPNWDKVFKQLQDQKKGKVTIFYCGPPQLGRILRYKCDQYGFIFKKETF